MHCHESFPVVMCINAKIDQHLAWGRDYGGINDSECMPGNGFVASGH